jgi:hypothetical protein
MLTTGGTALRSSPHALPAAVRTGGHVSSDGTLIPAERIGSRIFVLRGQKVLLDEDLAALYGVTTKVLVQAVKRNIERFPLDFAFELTAEEWRVLRSQFVTSKPPEAGPSTSQERRGGRRHSPHAFTEQGVAMLSGVLRSPRAVQVNIAIMRAFVRLRELLATNEGLARRVASLERKAGTHDVTLKAITDAFRKLLATRPPQSKARRIGFSEETSTSTPKGSRSSR